MKQSLIAMALVATFATTAVQAQQTVKVVNLVELSGPGTTSGTNFRNGLEMAFKEINAAGGILGRQVAWETFDTQSQPQTSKALAQKAVDNDAFMVMGPVFTGSILVSMNETMKAGIPNFTGGEGVTITLQKNPYVFRTSFSQANSMPKVAAYLARDVKARSVAMLYVNNDFGKGGRDVMTKELAARNIKLLADVSTESGQVDFAAAVLRIKQSNADALFAYTNEEESARLLRELRKQGYDKPIIGETTITGQKVIELAGDSANGARGHVGLTIDAPNPGILAFSHRYEQAFKSKSDHNGIKGYTAAYLMKAATEKVGKFDKKAVAAALRNGCFDVKKTPGILLDVCFDDKGDIDRESYMVEIKGGKQIVTAVLPPLNQKK